MMRKGMCASTVDKVTELNLSGLLNSVDLIGKCIPTASGKVGWFKRRHHLTAHLSWIVALPEAANHVSDALATRLDMVIVGANALAQSIVLYPRLNRNIRIG